MRAQRVLHTGVLAVVLSLVAAFWPRPQTAPQQVTIDADDIGGVVTGPDGPEGGAWVIAETRELGTRFAKIVVTDALGRYVVPDLPPASYDVWVRGYGLVDSPRRQSRPGAMLALTAVPAPTAAAAAQYYPAAYWYSMVDVHKETAGMGADGQRRVLNALKNNGCIGCHQLGGLATRTIPAEGFGTFPSSAAAWERRVRSGQAGQGMANQLGQFDGALLRALAGWTDRVAAGELPFAQPNRPSGVERNLVVTVRDWADEKSYLHDLIATDRRNPTVNAYGPLYGAPELSTDRIPILDPRTNTATVLNAPVRDANTPTTASTPPAAPSPYWGEEVIWDSRVNIHNPWMDEEGRVWLTARIRAGENPAFCRQGSEHPSARLFPLNTSGRHIAVYDPKTKDYKFVDTCYSTHHLQLDEAGMMWTSGGGQALGWLDSKQFLTTGDAERTQGWTAFILDTNGNGRRDAYVEPDQPVDPTQDKRINGGFYAVMPSPVDESVWGSNNGYPGSLLRVVPGSNPPATAITEIFTPPLPGWGIRGADIDRNGVVWASMGSGHLGSFDRRKCTGPLNGPAATGAHCPEGWEFFPFPTPGFRGIADNSVESSYYTWVDQFNTIGLGENTPVATGNLSDGFHALVYGKPVTLRVPYPMGFYAKGLDGRIDDPNAGWKGRGLWATSGDRVPWHMEGGKGTKPLIVHIQVRPDPLAR